jgi:hypothetical protein
MNAYDELHDQIRAMLHRSEEYQKEAEEDGDIAEVEKHSRVSCVLRELDRLAVAFAKNN